MRTRRGQDSGFRVQVLLVSCVSRTHTHMHTHNTEHTTHTDTHAYTDADTYKDTDTDIVVFHEESPSLLV